MSVYVSQQPVPNRHQWVPNLEPATKYGALKFIFQGEDQPYMKPQKSLAQAKEILKDFDSDQDYLLWPNTGDPAAMWCAILALTSIGVEVIPFLYWNNPRGNKVGYYAPMQINLKEQTDGT